MRLTASLLSLTLLASCGEPPSPLVTDSPVTTRLTEGAAPSIAGVPAGLYKTDPAHSSLVFAISHMGFAAYTSEFTRFSAELQIDPADPGAATLVATIDPSSLELTNGPEGFHAHMTGPDWLDVKGHPEWTFRSTKVALTGPGAADVTGAFTLRGVTRPVTLKVTFNGGYPGMQFDPHARIGFSAKGVLKRSDFGMDAAILDPATHMGVGDEISFSIETEMTGPPLPASGQPAPAPR